MVPRKVGEELRVRRLRMGLTQTDIARGLGVTRQYVSMVERGVEWDPDADKLVVWSQALGWADDYVLRRLGRTIMPVPDPSAFTDEFMEKVRQAVAAGVAQGVAEALQDRADGEADTDLPSGGPPPGLPRARLA